ncbi:hypothetical protein BDZ45DRAFT_694278 [Acephala macrosclerotiorum]|nr:hypothetical protein BDZ45DRAFT_694278 [Acephala macrosclerotiorum]
MDLPRSSLASASDYEARAMTVMIASNVEGISNIHGYTFPRCQLADNVRPTRMTYSSDHAAKQIKLEADHAPKQIKQEINNAFHEQMSIKEQTLNLDLVPQQIKQMANTKTRPKQGQAANKSNDRGASVQNIKARVPEVITSPIPTYAELLNKVHQLLNTANPTSEPKIRVVVPFITAHFNSHLKISSITTEDNEIYIQLTLAFPYKKVFVKKIFDHLTQRVQTEAFRLPTFQESLLQRQQELELQVRKQQLREQAALQQQDLREQSVIQRQKELVQQLQHAAHRCQEELKQAARNKEVRDQEELEQQEQEQQARGRHAREQHRRVEAAAREIQAREAAALKSQQELLQEALDQKAECVTKWLKDIPLIFPFSHGDLDAVKELMKVEVSQMAARPAPGASPYVCHLCPPGYKTGSIREFIGHMCHIHNLLLTEQDSKANLSAFRCPG